MGAVAFLLLAGLSGCTLPGAMFAGLGNATNGALSAIEGTQSTAQLSDYDATIVATRHAIADMGLTITKDEPSEDAHTFAFTDDRKGKGGVRVIRLTDRLVRLQVQVGVWGDRELGNLVLARVRHLMGYDSPGEHAVAHAPRQRRYMPTDPGVRSATFERRVLRPRGGSTVVPSGH